LDLHVAEKIVCVGGGITPSIEGFDQSGHSIGDGRLLGVATGKWRNLYGEVNFLSCLGFLRFDFAHASLSLFGFQWYLEMSGSIESLCVRLAITS
jgi:hypothetical protein